MPPFTSVTARRLGRNGPVAAAAALAAGLLVTVSSQAALAMPAAGAGLASPQSAPQTAPAAGPAGVQPAGFAVPAGSTMVATLHARTRKYASPDGRATGWVPETYFGVRSVLPVIATDPGWIRVRLAQRPDGSTAWIKSSAVTLNSTPYRIVINTGTMRLTLYKNGRSVFSAPAGVGTRSDPTPTGRFFVAFVEAPPKPNPGYGPFIMVTSAHSTAIGNWAGSGDAVIGIHGPLGDNREIGSRGARVSHGCIRLHEASQDRLRDVPAGSPVDIVR
jgi:lipoprotein-anchoring transpeptidase ErfK/SrfK